MGLDHGARLARSDRFVNPVMVSVHYRIPASGFLKGRDEKA